MKKIGYGYKRNPADFDGAEVDRVYVDGEKTNRFERRDMLKMDLRKGDELVLLAPGDLGSIGERGNLRSLIENDIGATITVHVPVKVKKRAGAPRKFDPTPETDARLQNMWHDLSMFGPYILKRAKLIGGEHIERHHMQQRYGNRSGKRRTLWAK